ERGDRRSGEAEGDGSEDEVAAADLARGELLQQFARCCSGHDGLPFAGLIARSLAPANRGTTDNCSTSAFRKQMLYREGRRSRGSKVEGVEGVEGRRSR